MVRGRGLHRIVTFVFVARVVLTRLLAVGLFLSVTGRSNGEVRCWARSSEPLRYDEDTSLVTVTGGGTALQLFAHEAEALAEALIAAVAATKNAPSLSGNSAEGDASSKGNKHE